MKIKFFPNNMKVARGEIHIVQERCKGCEYCVIHCPMKVLELSEEFNSKGYHPPVVINIDNCINCGLCEMLCPEFAIWSTLKEEIPVTAIESAHK